MTDWKPLRFPDAPEFAAPYEAHCSGLLRNRKTGRVIKPHRRKTDGYRSVVLHADGKRKFAYLHRLIAFTFHGDPPAGCDRVDHVDGVPWHNSADNLVWVNSFENSARRKDLLPAETSPHAQGKKSALEWAQRTVQISGETLREIIATKSK